MANEIQKIIMSLKPGEHAPILVMGGHEEGIVAWGKTLDEAGELILKYYRFFLKGE
jgi:hypothetical protein